MRYEYCKFGCDQSKIKGTLLVVESSSLDVSGLPLERCVRKAYLTLLRMRYKPYEFGFDRSLMKGILLGQESTPCAVSLFPLEGFS
jgi:hypothetical protein